MDLVYIFLSCALALANAESSFFDRTVQLSKSNGTNYVIGGTNAVRGEFPYQISLQIGSGYWSRHTCGGTILNNRWILTAGHCVWRSNPAIYRVKAGKYSLRSRENSEQVSQVAAIFIHPSYRGGVAPFDIALLKLRTPLQFNNYVRPVNLPKANIVPQGRAMLSGWGSISRTNRPIMPDILQKVMLPILDPNTCLRALSRLGAARSLHSTNICTGPLTGQYNVCSGDSGGPLVLKYGSREKEIVGVVSWGFIPCSLYGSPSVFVRVSAFINWINNTMSRY